jgi:hypothetical protein
VFEPYIPGLVAVSSFRALDDSREVAANQLRAKASWDLVFDRIILFGSPDERLAGPTTEFIPSEDFPRIALMSLVASWQDAPVAILNADIVVASDLKAMVNRGWAKQGMALTSQRLEFDPAKEDYFRARVVDYGADFFCALPAVWRQVYKSIPPAYRVGNGGWDNWLLGFLTLSLPRRFFDITSLGPIFHPRHGDRKRTPMEAAPPDRFITSGLGFPPQL